MIPQVLGRSLLYDREHMVAATFVKNSSKNYRRLVQLCKTAMAYHEEEIDGTLQHFVVFSRSAQDCQRAVAFLEEAENWNSLKIFVNGRLQFNSWDIRGLILCFLNSLDCQDPAAHCHREVRSSALGMIATPFVVPLNRERFRELQDEINDRESRKFLFPCSRLLDKNFRFQTDHPSSFESQIQAAGVRTGCALCPNFAPSRFRKLAPTFWERQ